VKLSKCALPLIVAALSGVTAEAASTATVTHAQWDLYRSDTNARVGSYSAEDTCVSAANALNVTRSYTCRTRTVVAVTYTASTTCPSHPADETRSQSCPSGTTGTWQQSRTYASAAYPTCWTAGSWSPSGAPSGFCVTDPNPDPNPPPPVTTAIFTDLTSAPTCARVTVYPAKTVTNAAGAGIPTHQGRCLEATPSTFNQSFWAGVQPGDVVTLRAGTYTQNFGEGTWYFAMGETYKKGTASLPIAVVAAPGEKVVMQASSRPPLMFGNGSQSPKRFAEYLTFAGIDYIGQSSCISGGGDSTDPSGGPDETGGRYIRIVGGSCTITDASSNTMTGLIDLGGDGWKVLGMAFHDPANRVVINNNHGIYIQNGADDVEVAYNDFQVHTGHVIQIHQDGTPKLYERLTIHDNVIHGVSYGDMRGVSVINVADASSASIARNKIYHQGQGGWGCINIYRGQVTVTDNDCTDSQGGLNLNGQYGGTRKVTATGNKICPLSGYSRVSIDQGATSAQLTETSPRACP
jgi:hypothetical protein